MAGREILDHFYIRRKGRAGEHAFEQIVAKQGVFRHAPGQCCGKRVDVVNAFAGK